MFARQALYHLNHSQPSLLLVIFQIGSCIYHDPPLSASWVAGSTGVHHHVWVTMLLIMLLLPKLVLNFWVQVILLPQPSK
jgi:hypothetical protein